MLELFIDSQRAPKSSKRNSNEKEKGDVIKYEVGQNFLISTVLVCLFESCLYAGSSVVRRRGGNIGILSAGPT